MIGQEDYKGGYLQKDFIISAIDLLFEAGVFGLKRLKKGREALDDFEFVRRHQKLFPFAPRLFKLFHQLNKLRVVFQLRVNNFNVFIIFSQQESYSVIRLNDLLNNSYNSSWQFLFLLNKLFSFDEDFFLEVISTFSINICN